MHTAIRPALALTAALVLGLALPQPAAAHGDTLEVLITGHRDGHVLTKVTWENDGDPVDEQVAAVVDAISADGRRTAGPWKLRRGARPTDWTTAETLPAGVWEVTVAVGHPGLGHAEGQLTVTAALPSSGSSSAANGATATSAPTRMQEKSPAPGGSRRPSASHSAPTDQDKERWVLGPTTIGLAAASLTGAAAGIWIRRRRGRR
ncbi:hypothetical protein [Streptomyces sp. NPDC051921]|uniref:hypothetical protein n=1 Tax=Streptomyces sp. NPDC051921 TaxID=3155806 RepID=UPI00342F9F9B